MLNALRMTISDKASSLLISLVLLACGLSFYPMEKDVQAEQLARQKALATVQASPPKPALTLAGPGSITPAGKLR